MYIFYARLKVIVTEDPGKSRNAHIELKLNAYGMWEVGCWKKFETQK
jgi:hypothetical protein